MAECQYRGADKSLARTGGNKLGSMSGTRAISTTSRHELSSSFFSLQGKAPKEIHAILTETLSVYTLNLGARLRLVVTCTIFRLTTAEKPAVPFLL